MVFSGIDVIFYGEADFGLRIMSLWGWRRWVGAQKAVFGRFLAQVLGFGGT